MHLFGSDQRKPLSQVKPHLRAKDGNGACTGAVGFNGASIQDLANEVEVLAHKKDCQLGVELMAKNTEPQLVPFRFIGSSELTKLQIAFNQKKPSQWWSGFF